MQDKDHEGHGGWTIDQIAGASVSDFQAGLKPDIILLHAGTNDCNGNVDPANAPTRLGNLLDGLTNAWPDAAVLVAKIIPSSSGPVNDCINTYNAGVQDIAVSRYQSGKRVGIVDMSTVLDLNSDLADFLHPNDSGYKKMADAWFSGLNAILGSGWI